MERLVHFNGYISDTNPLKLGYIEIWGVGSAAIADVSLSVTSTVITPSFTYDSAAQVCDQRKV